MFKKDCKEREEKQERELLESLSYKRIQQIDLSNPLERSSYDLKGLPQIGKT